MSLDKKRSAKGELVFTSFLFVAGVVVLWDASQLKESIMADYLGSKTFPTAVGTLMVVLSALQLISVFRGNLGEPEGIEGGKADSKVHIKPLLLMLAGLSSFAIGIRYIGFPLAATALFSFVVFALEPKKAKFYIVIPIAAAFAALIYFGFTLGLQISLPWGFDFNFGTAEVVVEEEW